MSLGGLGQTLGKSRAQRKGEPAGGNRDTGPHGNQRTESGQVTVSSPLHQDMEKMGGDQKGENSNQDLEVGGPEPKSGDSMLSMY